MMHPSLAGARPACDQALVDDCSLYRGQGPLLRKANTVVVFTGASPAGDTPVDHRPAAYHSHALCHRPLPHTSHAR